MISLNLGQHGIKYNAGSASPVQWARDYWKAEIGATVHHRNAKNLLNKIIDLDRKNEKANQLADFYLGELNAIKEKLKEIYLDINNKSRFHTSICHT